jgi:predicted outer membrane repeat protein
MKYVILVIAAIVAAVNCQARTIYVNADGTGDYPTIQDAINNADHGDTIVLQPGTYTGNGSRDIDFLGKAITVQSTDPEDPCVAAGTVIDCQGRYRGFYLSSGEGPNSVLAGLKIINGHAAPDFGGGGIFCQDSSPTISNCIFQENSAIEGMLCVGGGISCWNSYATITNCTFVENYAAGSGAGIYSYGGRPTITGCTFISNSASAVGGAIDIDTAAGSTLVTGCTFSGNSSGYGGGGIFSQRANLKVTNCMFIGNSSEQWSGGGAYDVATLTNCTFFGNTAATRGGGTGNYNVTLTITNCIMWGNSDAGGMDESAQVDNGSWLSAPLVNYCCIQGLTGGLGGTGNIGADPCFVAASGGDYHLTSDSECINAGDPNYVPEPNETDLDGNARVIDGRIDMGAYEFQPQQNTAPVADAGPNQVAYAWIDGIAEVTLDGSASYDPDGDELTYLWTWAIDGNDYEANGVSPTIELPVGEHQIELVVNDGFEDSEPNQTTVTVIGPIKGTLWLTPQIIHRQCLQKRIMAMLRLPEGITKDQIDASRKLTLYPGGVKAVNQCILPSYVYGAKRVCIYAFFDRDEVLEAIGGNRFVKVYAVSQLKTGQYLYGTSFIRIINPWRWPRWGNMREWFGNWNQHHPCIQNKR